MSTQIHALSLGERIGYQFTISAVPPKQNENSRFRISNLVLDCEEESFRDVTGNVNTIHVCRTLPSGGIGDSIAGFVSDGEINADTSGLSENQVRQIKLIPEGYKRIVFRYFSGNSNTSSFITLIPGTYWLVPSAGYGPDFETTGLVSIDGGNSVTPVRKFRFQKFSASSASSRTRTISQEGNEMVITFSNRIIEQTRNAISGRLMSTKTIATNYLPIIAMGVRKVFRSRINNIVEAPDIPTINDGITLFPTRTNINQISTSMNTFGSHNIDYVFSTQGGKHMLGTQKQFVVLNGRIHNDTDTSFNVPPDTALKDVNDQQGVKAGSHYPNNTEQYKILFREGGYGVIYDQTQQSDFYLDENGTNIRSIIVPFGYNGINWITGWDGNVMGIRDASMLFIHRTGWYTEQNLTDESTLDFREIELDSSGIITAGSFSILSYARFNDNYRHVYVHDTSLFSQNLNYGEPDHVSYIAPLLTASQGYFNAKTSVFTQDKKNKFLNAEGFPSNSHVLLLTPYLNFIDTLLDTSGHMNTEVRYENKFPSQQWVMSNAYNQEYDNSFGYINLRNSYDNYELGNIEVIDETDVVETGTDTNGDFTLMHEFGQYVSQDNIIDLTGSYMRYASFSAPAAPASVSGDARGAADFELTTPQESGEYGIKFTSLDDTVINTVRVFSPKTKLSGVNSVDLEAYLYPEGEHDSHLAKFIFSEYSLSDQPDGYFSEKILGYNPDEQNSNTLVDNTPEIILMSLDDYELKSNSRYDLVFNAALARVSSYVSKNTLPVLSEHDAFGRISLTDALVSIDGNELSVSEYMTPGFYMVMVPIYTFDSLVEDNYFEITGVVNNQRNVRNASSYDNIPSGFSLSDLITRDIVIKSTISNDGNSAIIDVSFDNNFALHDLGHEHNVPAPTVSVTICGEEQVSFIYDKDIHKFISEIHTDLVLNEAVDIHLRYESTIDQEIEGFVFGLDGRTLSLSDYAADGIKVNDPAAFLNMCLTWNSGPVNTVRLVYNQETKLISDGGTIYYQCNNDDNGPDNFFSCGFDDITVLVESNDVIAIALNSDTVGSQEFTFTGAVPHSHGDVAMQLGNDREVTNGILSLFGKIVKDGNQLWISNGKDKERQIIDITMDADKIVLYLEGEDYNNTGVVTVSVRDEQSSALPNLRETHLFIATNCIANSNTLTFQPRDPLYVYELFTKNLTGNVLSHAKPNSSSLGSFSEDKYLVEKCWFSANGEDYDWNMSLIPMGDSQTIEDSTFNRGTNYFYLSSPAETSVSLVESSIRLPAVMSNDSFNPGYKLTTNLPEFGDGISLDVYTGQSKIQTVATETNLTLEKIMSPYQKRQVSDVRSIINDNILESNPILMSLGHRSKTVNHYPYTEFDPGSLFHVTHPDPGNSVAFDGHEISISVNLDIPGGNNQLLIFPWMVYPLISMVQVQNGSNSDKNYSTRILNNSSKLKVTVTEPNSLVSKEATYISWNALSLWAYAFTERTGTFKFTFSGAPVITLFEQGEVQTDISATVTYKAEPDDDEVETNYIPLVSLSAVGDSVL